MIKVRAHNTRALFIIGLIFLIGYNLGGRIGLGISGIIVLAMQVFG